MTIQATQFRRLCTPASPRPVWLRFLRALAITLLPAWSSLSPSVVQAQPTVQAPGLPDATFNGTGVLLSTPFPGNVGQIMAAVVVQPDGKTVVVGSCNTTGGTVPSVEDGWGFCAVRYNLDGSLDTGFGIGGKWKRRDRTTASSLTTFDSFARSAALQSDGTLVIAGTCRNTEVCIARVTPAGTSGLLLTRITPTFTGGNGMKVAIQADQKILVVTDSGNQPKVARLTDLGVVDSSYGVSGIATANSPTVSTTNYRVRDAYVDPTSGKLMGLGGRSIAPAGANAEIFRFNTNGSIDSTFDADGFASVQITNGNFSSGAFAMAPRLGGGVEVAVLGSNATGSGVFLGSIRLSVNGAGDTTHGPNGLRFSSAQYGGVSGCLYEAAKVLPDGKIVAVGHSALVVNASQEFAFDVCRIRLNSDQSIDSSFAIGPTVFASNAPYGEYFFDAAMAVGKDAKIVTADSCRMGQSGATLAFCLQRFDYLAQNCYDIDGDGNNNPLVDGLIMLRAQLGLRDNAVTDGIGIPLSAPRKTWSTLRDFMLFSCGMRGL